MMLSPFSWQLKSVHLGPLLRSIIVMYEGGRGFNKPHRALCIQSIPSPLHDFTKHSSSEVPRGELSFLLRSLAWRKHRRWFKGQVQPGVENTQHSCVLVLLCIKWSEALTQIWQSMWAMTFFCSCVFLVIVPGPNGHTLLGWQRGASRNTCSKGWVGELTYSYHDWKIHVKNVIHEILLSIYSVHLEQCAAGNYFLKGWVFTELYKTFEALKST